MIYLSAGDLACGYGSSVSPSRVTLGYMESATVTVTVNVTCEGLASNLTASASGGSDSSLVMGVESGGERPFIEVEVLEDVVGRLQAFNVLIHSSERNVTLRIYAPSGSLWKEYGVTLNHTGSWADVVAEVTPPGSLYRWEDRERSLGTVRARSGNCHSCNSRLESECSSRAEPVVEELLRNPDVDPDSVQVELRDFDCERIPGGDWLRRYRCSAECVVMWRQLERDRQGNPVRETDPSKVYVDGLGGEWTVVGVAVTGGGLELVDSDTFTLNDAPVVSASARAESGWLGCGCPGRCVAFSMAASDPDGNLERAEWTWSASGTSGRSGSGSDEPSGGSWSRSFGSGCVASMSDCDYWLRGSVAVDAYDSMGYGASASASTLLYVRCQGGGGGGGGQGDQGVNVHVRCSSGQSLEGDVYLDGSWVGRGSDLSVPTSPGTHSVRVVTDYGSESRSVTVRRNGWGDEYFYFDCPTGPVCVYDRVTGDLHKGGSGTYYFAYCVDGPGEGEEDACYVCRREVESEDWVMRVASPSRVVAEGRPSGPVGFERRTYGGATYVYALYALSFDIPYGEPAGDWMAVTYPWLTTSFFVEPGPVSAKTQVENDRNVTVYGYNAGWDEDPATWVRVFGKLAPPPGQPIRTGRDEGPGGPGTCVYVNLEIPVNWRGYYEGWMEALAGSSEVPTWGDRDTDSDTVYGAPK